MTQGDILPEAQKLTGDNYQTWKSRCKLLLMKENTWQYVDPTGTNPPVAGEADDIKQARIKALYSINMSCREDIFNSLSEVSYPRVAWNTLKDRFESSNNASRLMLLDKLNSVRLQEGGSVMEYIKKIQELKLQLKGVGHNISETDLVERMLGTLPASYESVYQQVSGLTAMPTLENMTTRLLQAETRLQFRQTSTGVMPASVDALAARFQRTTITPYGQQQPGFGPSYQGHRSTFQHSYRPTRQSSTGPRSCTFCGSIEHFMRNCPDPAEEIARC
jgi:hypothetical protein